MSKTSPIRIINLSPVYFDCQRCSAQVYHATAWPYYETFLPPDDPNPEKGYVPLCDPCYGIVERAFARAQP